jgi:lysophospholipid acyltransferase (LPLAT)-like uncharacterized protein
MSLLQQLTLAVVPTVGYTYIRALHATMRLEYRNAEVLRRVREESGPYILAFWHSRLIMMPYAYPGDRIVILTSEHSDAELLVRVLERFGHVMARGSSTRGGARGLRQILRRVREGHDVALTPDGPRGPSRRVKPGVVTAARLAGAPIIPVAFSARPVGRLRSWDRTLLPAPWGRGLYLYGEPQHVGAGSEDAEADRMRLEQELNRLTDLADGEMGLASEPFPSKS